MKIKQPDAIRLFFTALFPPFTGNLPHITHSLFSIHFLPLALYQIESNE
jgi:hypothetical protein